MKWRTHLRCRTISKPAEEALVATRDHHRAPPSHAGVGRAQPTAVTTPARRGAAADGAVLAAPRLYERVSAPKTNGVGPLGIFILLVTPFPLAFPLRESFFRHSADATRRVAVGVGAQRINARKGRRRKERKRERGEEERERESAHAETLAGDDTRGANSPAI